MSENLIAAVTGNLIAAVTGALVGAIVSTLWNFHITRWREKKALALEIFNDYLVKYDNLAHVYDLLDSPSKFEGNEIKANIFYNLIRSMGNWFNLVSYLYLEDLIDKEIIEKSKMYDAIIDFGEKVRSSKVDLHEEKEFWNHITSILNKSKTG